MHQPFRHAMPMYYGGIMVGFVAFVAIVVIDRGIEWTLGMGAVVVVGAVTAFTGYLLMTPEEQWKVRRRKDLQ